MNENKSPLEVGEIVEKIDKGKVKVKGTRKSKGKSKSKKSKGVKGERGQISDAKVIAYLTAEGEHVTSTQLRDNLHFKSRTQARRVLKRLAKPKKVHIEKRKLSDKRTIYTYGIA